MNGSVSKYHSSVKSKRNSIQNGPSCLNFWFDISTLRIQMINDINADIYYIDYALHTTKGIFGNVLGTLSGLGNFSSYHILWDNDVIKRIK